MNARQRLFNRARTINIAVCGGSLAVWIITMLVTHGPLFYITAGFSVLLSCVANYCLHRAEHYMYWYSRYATIKKDADVALGRLNDAYERNHANHIRWTRESNQQITILRKIKDDL